MILSEMTFPQFSTLGATPYQSQISSFSICTYVGLKCVMLMSHPTLRKSNGAAIIDAPIVKDASCGPQVYPGFVNERTNFMKQFY